MAIPYVYQVILAFAIFCDLFSDILANEDVGLAYVTEKDDIRGVLVMII